MVVEIVPFVLNSFYYASVLFLIAAGLNIIYGVMRIINLAHGSLFAIGAYVSAWLIGAYTGLVPPYMLFILPFAGALAAALVSLMVEPTLIRPMYGRRDEYQLLITFGLLLIIEDSLRLVWGAQPLRASAPFALVGDVLLFGLPYPNYMLLIIFIGLLTAALLWAFIYKTKFGLLLRATSLDREIASSLGVNVRRLYTVSFSIGALVAGLGGAFVVPVQTAFLGLAIEVLILAFVVMVIGGLGSLKGSFIGAFIVGAVRSFIIVVLPELELAVLYLIAAAVLLARPAGLFGRE